MRRKRNKKEGRKMTKEKERLMEEGLEGADKMGQKKKKKKKK